MESFYSVQSTKPLFTVISGTCVGLPSMTGTLFTSHFLPFLFIIVPVTVERQIYFHILNVVTFAIGIPCIRGFFRPILGVKYFLSANEFHCRKHNIYAQNNHMSC